MNLKVGDRVERLTGPEGSHFMYLVVTEVTDDIITCGAWTFHARTGGEVDEYLGWDGVTKTGTFIRPAAPAVAGGAAHGGK